MAPSAPRSQSFTNYLHRTRIVEAAANVFARRGTRSVSVEEILKAADVSRRTFYRFFRSKGELLAVLYEVSCQFLIDSFAKAVAGGGDPVAKIERCVDGYLALDETDGAFLRVLEAEALGPDSPLASRRVALLDALAALLASELKVDGGERPDELYLMGLLLGIEGVSQWLYSEGTPTRARRARARQVMVRILLGAVRPTPRR